MCGRCYVFQGSIRAPVDLITLQRTPSLIVFVEIAAYQAVIPLMPTGSLRGTSLMSSLWASPQTRWTVIYNVPSGSRMAHWPQGHIINTVVITLHRLTVARSATHCGPLNRYCIVACKYGHPLAEFDSQVIVHLMISDPSMTISYVKDHTAA